MTNTKTIHGLLCEFDSDCDGAGTTSCDISRGDFSGSLSMLLDHGYLLNSRDVELPVPVATQTLIENWALSQGY